MKETVPGMMIDGKNFSIDGVFSGKDVLPFPLRAVDMSTPSAVHMPEQHIGIRQQTPPNQLLATMNETGVWNIIQLAQADIEQRLKVAGRLIQNPRAFLEHPGKQFFELASSKSDKVKGGEHRWAFRATSQKRYILNMISSYVFSVPGAKALADSILFVADELFTNALYNAPFGDKGHQLDKSTMVFLDPKLSPEMVVAHNSKHLFLGCLDHFGAFDCEEFLKRTSETTKLNAKNFLKSDISGGGFGVLRIIDLAPDIFIVIEKGKRGFIGCLFPLNASVKKVKEASRNFFFKSFENYEAGRNSIVIEKRGGRVLLGLVGTFDSSMPTQDLNFQDSTEIFCDLRLLEGIIEEDFKNFIATIKSVKSVKKISFDFVPMRLFQQVSHLVGFFPGGEVAVSSVWNMLTCPQCQASQNVVLKPLADDQTHVKSESFDCPACGAHL